jgi:Polyketide cyclase / dehydrase and lipid transport
MADTYRVTRSTTIAATPDLIYPHLADFHRWQAWSPWEELDPDQNRTYSGPDSGPGAHYAWNGNKKVGEGTMEILEAQSPSTVVVDLRFIKPFKSTAVTRFDVELAGEGSTVTWTMEGAKTVVTRVMGVFKSMDAMIGPDFEKGLRQLKATVEGAAD